MSDVFDTNTPTKASKAPSSTELVTSIPQLSGTITELATFFYKFRSQQMWREEVNAQGLKFKQTVVAGTMEAEGGQAIARRIVYLLNKVKKSPPRDILEDLLGTLKEKIEAHLTLAKQVQSGFIDVQSGLHEIYANSTSMLSRIASDGLLRTVSALIAALMKSAAYQRYQAVIQTGQILHDMCDRINDVIMIIAQHIGFWSDLSARITHQLNGLTPKNLTKNNGQIAMGIAEESEEEWSNVEALYQQYASTARLANQVLEE